MASGPQSPPPSPTAPPAALSTVAPAAQPAPAPAPALADPYATTKANLRDTIKWLAATFSALAAVVIAGAPLSGLGKLPFGFAWVGAVVALGAAFFSICIALAITISLLRGDFLYFSDIIAIAKTRVKPAAPAGLNPKPAKASRGLGLKGFWQSLFPGQSVSALDEADRENIRVLCDNIDAHPGDVLSFAYLTIEELATEADERKEKLIAARAAWKAKPTDVAVDAVDQATDDIDELSVEFQRVQFFGTAYLFYSRMRRAMFPLFILGISALVLLVIFGSLVQQPDKASPAANSVVNNFSSPRAASEPAVAQALPKLTPVLFRTGDAALDATALNRIDAARAALRANPRASLLLYAHTDTVAGDHLNEGLAHRRGAAVRSALIREGGLDAARILVSEQPKSGLPELTGADTDSQTNRAVVMVLVDLP
jgi:hypothetical protein